MPRDPRPVVHLLTRKKQHLARPDDRVLIPYTVEGPDNAGRFTFDLAIADKPDAPRTPGYAWRVRAVLAREAGSWVIVETNVYRVTLRVIDSAAELAALTRPLLEPALERLNARERRALAPALQALVQREQSASTVEPPTPVGITTSVLRSVRIEDIHAVANHHLEAADLGRIPRPSKKPGNGDRELARWAARYVKAVAAGSRSPRKDLAEQYAHEIFGQDGDLIEDPRARDAWIRDRLREARSRGLLTAAERGRAGGSLTDKGRAALERRQV